MIELGPWVYLSVFGVLIGSTIAELSIIGLRIPSNILITSLVGLAGAKAVLIALFFQHLKDEPRALSYFLIIGLVLVIVLMTISFLQVHV